ncbi:MAG: quinone oxidoreductase [Acidobacteria bacterium]|jgi:NADPH:quinone reductase|nr:MAG: quinone oxidoreductase [Acidobacteriota bacterium]
MKTIRIEAHGGPEQIKLHESPSPAPGPGQALLQITAAGVNFMDIGGVNGMYQLEPLPFTPGVEGAGRIVALGEGVDHLRVGGRVGWFFVLRSYAEQIAAPIDALVPLPDTIEDETAASLMMQGLTASHFATETHAIKRGDIALVHSAAGGVGLMLTQIIKLLGGKVIGRVSNESKAEIARAAGADHVIVESGGAFADEVRRLTNGEGVHVTYPRVHHHVLTREALLTRSRQLFDWVESGQLKVNVGKRYPLANAAQAHIDITSRRTTGKLLLIP